MKLKLLGMGIIGMLALGACAPANTAGTATDGITVNTTPTTPSTAPPETAGTDTAPATVATTPAPATTTATTAQSSTTTTATMTGDPSGQYQVKQQPTAPADITPVGTVTISQTPDGMTKSDVMLTGLAPSTYYVTHFHTQGTAAPEPCASGGAALLVSKIVGQTDAQGVLSMSGSVATSEIMNATYFNIHTATGADGTPADPGVACTPLMRK